MMLRPTVLIVTLCALVATGCGAGGPQGSEVVGEGGGRFPARTLEDWKSYADHVVVYSVVAEEEIPPDAEEQARGEGMIGRVVDLRIDERLWSAPNAPALPDEVTMRVAGSVLHDGKRRPFRLEGSPRVELGQQFLAPLVRVEEPAVEWWPLSTDASLPVVDGRIQPDESSQNAVGGEFAGRTVAEFRDAFASQEPDPLAAKHRDLRPTERVEAVLEQGGFDDG